MTTPQGAAWPHATFFAAPSPFRRCRVSAASAANKPALNNSAVLDSGTAIAVKASAPLLKAKLPARPSN